MNQQDELAFGSGEIFEPEEPEECEGCGHPVTHLCQCNAARMEQFQFPVFAGDADRPGRAGQHWPERGAQVPAQPVNAKGAA